jgi:hypothetical protein
VFDIMPTRTPPGYPPNQCVRDFQLAHVLNFAVIDWCQTFIYTRVHPWQNHLRSRITTWPADLEGAFCTIVSQRAQAPSRRTYLSKSQKKFEPKVNLRIAKALDLRIPQSALLLSHV